MRLKEARFRAGLSQVALAARLGVSQPSVHAWEVGNARPRPSLRKKIAELLGPVEYADAPLLTTNEQRQMFSAIEIAARRIGHERALALFSDQDPDEVRALTEFVMSGHEENLMMPPGVEIRRTR